MKSKRLTTAQISELISIDKARARDGTGGIREEVQELIVRLTSSGLTKQDNADGRLGHFIPIADSDVPAEYQVTLAKYRKLAAEYGVPATTPVCYRVKAGFTLKTHASKAGPCHEGYEYLHGWDFPDEATEACFVFWVPRIVRGSTSKTKSEQGQLLADLRIGLELPAHHMGGFGKVGLVAGLILAHYKSTGERIPLNEYWVRTDTCHAVGDRLCLGRFGDAGLCCSGWGYIGDADRYVGVFALGVELGPSIPRV